MVLIDIAPAGLSDPIALALEIVYSLSLVGSSILSLYFMI